MSDVIRIDDSDGEVPGRAYRPSAAGQAMSEARLRTQEWLRIEADLRLGKAAADLRAAGVLLRESDARFGTEFAGLAEWAVDGAGIIEAARDEQLTEGGTDVSTDAD